MEKKLYDNCVAVLNKELMLALGCTEPIAIAYAGAKARELLGQMPQKCTCRCSGNIIKNVKGVVVPNSGGMRGIDTAAVLGIVGGRPDQVLAVLENVTESDIKTAQSLREKGFCTSELVEGVENLYIDLLVSAGEHSAEIEIRDTHSNITKMVKDGKTVFSAETEGALGGGVKADKSLLNLALIHEFANCVKIEDVKDLILRQVKCNSAISAEGLTHAWGAQVGRTLREISSPQDFRAQASAAAAAGSDARMSGCPLPVVINSGSGNQGITITMPIVTYAERNSCSEEQLIRALCLANLISVHQKKYIGSLSAYCGAVSAATAAACGVGYLMGESFEVLCDTITNSICTTGGIVCDGAKSSCAAKIAAAVNFALVGLEMARKKRVFQVGEGLLGADTEGTIANIGRMGRVGMKSTDVEILNIMLGN